jgi:Tfp pilus assembly protein PilV
VSRGWTRHAGRLADEASGRLATLRSDAGDTLIEVLTSALVVGVMVIGTFTGLTATNRASALGRSRTQAQALAEKDEERLRGEPISQLAALNGTTKTNEVKIKGTAVNATYTITSKVTYINEKGTSDCATEASEGFYRTISEVTWTGNKGPAIVETGSIAPPAGATLIVRVEGAEKGEGVEGMSVTAKGPGSSGSTYEQTTTGEGCALFGPFEEGGEYTVNILRTGYVNQDWYSQLKEDPAEKLTWNLLTNVATKAAYRFAPAGTLKANLTTAQPTGLTTPLTTAPLAIGKSTWNPESKVLNLMVSNTEGMKPELRTLLKTSTLRSGPLTSESPGVFPFPTKYAVYAGTCEANSPSKFTAAPAEVKVPPNGTGETEVKLPTAIVEAYKGSTETASEAVKWNEPTFGKFYIKDQGCSPTEKRELAPVTTVGEWENQGDLKNPGLPYGKYTICNEWTQEGKTYSVENLNEEVPEAGKNWDNVQLYRSGKALKSC